MAHTAPPDIAAIAVSEHNSILTRSRTQFFLVGRLGQGPDIKDQGDTCRIGDAIGGDVDKYPASDR